MTRSIPFRPFVQVKDSQRSRPLRESRQRFRHCLVPSRGKYSAASNDWQVALSYLYAYDYAPSEALWFSLPDVVASVLLTGKAPVIVDAFKLVPYGKLADLKPIRLGGEVSVNPLTQDLFRTIIEQRKSLPKRKDLPKEDVDLRRFRSSLHSPELSKLYRDVVPRARP